MGKIWWGHCLISHECFNHMWNCASIIEIRQPRQVMESGTLPPQQNSPSINRGVLKQPLHLIRWTLKFPSQEQALLKAMTSSRLLSSLFCNVLLSWFKWWNMPLNKTNFDQKNFDCTSYSKSNRSGCFGDLLCLWCSMMESQKSF